MNMQQAEEILGLRFRGRRVYLEQRGMNKEQVDSDEDTVKRDCHEFAVIMKKMTASRRPSSLIIQPGQPLN